MTKPRSNSIAWLLAVPVILVAFLVALFLINNRPPKITIPTPVMPKDNGWDYFVRAGEMLGKTRHWGPYSMADRKPEDWTLAELEAFAKANAPALELVRTGLEKPFRYPPVRSYKESADLMPHQASFREIGRTFAGEARYREVADHPAEAVDSLLDCVDFAVTLGKGSSFLPWLTGCAIESMGTTHLEPLLPRLNVEALNQTAERTARIQQKRPPYEQIVLEESDEVAVCQATVFKNPEVIRSMIRPHDWIKGSMLPDSSGSAAQNVWRTGHFVFSNKAAAIRENKAYGLAVAEEALKPYAGKSSVPVPKNLLSYSVKGVVDGRVIYAYKEATLNLLQTEVALRRYHAGHGKYPDKLSRLVPEYLKSEPIDPFGLGKPLRYQQKDEGRSFLLYSLGPNMRDDGGTPGKREGETTPGDLVAGKPHKP